MKSKWANQHKSQNYSLTIILPKIKEKTKPSPQILSIEANFENFWNILQYNFEIKYYLGSCRSIMFMKEIWIFNISEHFCCLDCIFAFLWENDDLGRNKKKAQNWISLRHSDHISFYFTQIGYLSWYYLQNYQYPISGYWK